MFTGYWLWRSLKLFPMMAKWLAREVDAYVVKFAQECFNESPDGQDLGQSRTSNADAQAISC
jgi:hypothetical protein